MKKTDVSFLAAACGGKLIGNTTLEVENVQIDSRSAGAGSMFVCVVGEKNDGHNYISNAYAQGCRVFLISDENRVEHLEECCFILSADTVRAFEAMAKAYLDQFDLIRVGVTGSVGKTTTKELCAAVLSARYKVVATKKNYNTHLGLCLTAFDADETTRAVVFEMGMDKPGEIHEYCEWARPDAALITCVGISHLERLGTRDAIADAKLEITHFLAKDAPLIVNCDSDYLSAGEIAERAPGNYRCLTTGRDPESMYRISDIQDLGNDGISFKLDGREFTLPVLGVHNASNAALAIVLGEQFGVSPDEAAFALAAVKAYSRRLQTESCGGIFLIDGSYNASPDSVEAGLSVLASVKAKRRIAVLSDMLELGSEEEAGHLSVGRFAAEKNIDFLIAIGSRAAYYIKGAKSTGKDMSLLSFVSNDAAMLCLDNMLVKGDAVLVKGSNSTRVSEIAAHIREKYSKQE